MGSISGAGEYSSSGYIGAAVVGSTVTLSFKHFETSAKAMPLSAILTINGNLKKRHIHLGSLAGDRDSFDLVVPEGTDISLFNTVVLQLAGTETAIGIASIP
ncbi:MAG: hypothetical protein LVS60_12165 [Nodosilinea sp. LVE1205-7]|jgi:hypothetical protein